MLVIILCSFFYLRPVTPKTSSPEETPPTSIETKASSTLTANFNAPESVKAEVKNEEDINIIYIVDSEDEEESTSSSDAPELDTDNRLSMSAKDPKSPEMESTDKVERSREGSSDIEELWSRGEPDKDGRYSCKLCDIFTSE